MTTQDNDFARAVVLMQEALSKINDAVLLVDGDLPELFHAAAWVFAPNVLGQVIMSHLPQDPYMTPDDKLRWLRVSDEIGPDWIDAFKKVGAFMAKTSEF